MASASHATLQLPPLTKQSMAQLLAEAKRIGMLPEDYAKRIVEDALSLQREAEEKSFSDVMKPVRKAAGPVDDAEIVKLVEKARTNHRRNNGRGKKR